MEKRAALLVRLTSAVAGSETALPLASRLCRALTEMLHADGGAVSVGFTPHGRAVLCATDDAAERIEELQDMLREGPSLDAFRLRRALSASTEELSTTWPELAQCMPAGLASAHLIALPMRPFAEVLGVISLYHRVPPTHRIDLAEAQTLADAIGVAILGGYEVSGSSGEIWPDRDQLDQAIGMVVAQLRIAPADALAVLRAHAFAHGTRMTEVAGSILSRELDFCTTGGDEHNHSRTIDPFDR